MKRLSTVLALAFGLLTIVPGIHAQGTPRLVVVLVVDQMRADYLQTFDRHWHGGFRTLLSEGSRVRQRAIPVFEYAHVRGRACRVAVTEGAQRNRPRRTRWRRSRVVRRRVGIVCDIACIRLRPCSRGERLHRHASLRAGERQLVEAVLTCGVIRDARRRHW